MTAKAPTTTSTTRSWCALSQASIPAVGMPKRYLDRKPSLQSVRGFATINLEAGS
jgi:hypothetical protein